MRTRVLTLLLLAGVLAGCGNEGSTPSEAPKAAGSAPSAHQSDGLSRDEFVFATKVAKHEQRRVKGTFVGATARADGPGVLQIRLVWDSAKFTHGGVVGGLPDGPRQALVFTARIA